MFLMRILVIWYKIIVWVKKQICQWRYDWLGEKVLRSSASLSWLPQPLVCLHNFSFLNPSSKHRKETKKKSKLVVLFSCDTHGLCSRVEFLTKKPWTLKSLYLQRWLLGDDRFSFRWSNIVNYQSARIH